MGNKNKKWTHFGALKQYYTKQKTIAGHAKKKKQTNKQTKTKKLINNTIGGVIFILD